MNLHELAPVTGSTHVNKRKGRGTGTGNGETWISDTGIYRKCGQHCDDAV